jgi:predicted homoserine dehydrogenase-like protein
LAQKAPELKQGLSDYIISAEAPPGVFIVGTHNEELAPNLKTYKMGDGPFYLHYKPTHLCFFETPKTLNRFYHNNSILLDNSLKPRVGVAAIAKQLLLPGTYIDNGIGSFDMRGEALNISDQPDMVPIGLMNKATIKRKIEPGQIITFNDVDLPDSLALKAWTETVDASVNILNL